MKTLSRFGTMLALLLAILFSTGVRCPAAPAIGLQWTMPTTNAQPNTVTVPNGCDLVGAAIPAGEYLRWTVFRTNPLNPLVLVDSLASGTAQKGAAVSRLWTEMRPVPIPGTWSFVVVAADTLGKKCPPKMAVTIVFAAKDTLGPAPVSVFAPTQ